MVCARRLRHTDCSYSSAVACSPRDLCQFACLCRGSQAHAHAHDIWYGAVRVAQPTAEAPSMTDSVRLFGTANFAKKHRLDSTIEHAAQPAQTATALFPSFARK